MDATSRKSSYSGSGGGNCIEVADAPGTVLVRDSRDPDGPRLALGRARGRRRRDPAGAPSV